MNASEPSLSSNDVIASGSGKKTAHAQRQKHVHFSGTESEERTVRRPSSSQSDQLPTKDYEVSWVASLVYAHFIHSFNHVQLCYACNSVFMLIEHKLINFNFCTIFW